MVFERSIRYVQPFITLSNFCGSERTTVYFILRTFILEREKKTEISSFEKYFFAENVF